MRFLTLAFVAAALFTATQPAAAATVVMPQLATKSAQVCYISGNFSNRARAAAEIANMKSCAGIGTTEAFIAFKVEPMTGLSTTPIIHQVGRSSVCVFLKNTSANTYFIPAGSDADWNAFFTSVNSGRLAGMSVVPCTSAIGDGQGFEPVKDLCGGRLTSDGSYADGFSALSNVPADLSAKRVYSIVNAQNQVLRVLTAVPTSQGWKLSYDRECPSQKQQNAGGTGTAVTASAVSQLAANAGTVQTPVRTASVAAPAVTTTPVANVATPAAAAPTFNRNAAPTTDRVFITDGATVRHIY